MGYKRREGGRQADGGMEREDIREISEREGLKLTERCSEKGKGQKRHRKGGYQWNYLDEKA